MKYKHKNRILSFLTLIFRACGGGGNSAPSRTAEIAGKTASLVTSATHSVEETVHARRSLEELAEFERFGSYFQGLALAESANEKAAVSNGRFAERLACICRGLI